MKLDDAKLKKILLDGSFLSEEDLKTAETQAKKSRGGLREHLFSTGLINKSILGQAIAESFKLSYIDLSTKTPNQEVLNSISEAEAKKHRILPLSSNKKTLEACTDSPDQKNLEKTLKKLFPKKKAKLFFTLPEEVDSLLNRYRKPLNTRFSSILKKKKGIAPELINEILLDATSFHASDIHFEPQGADVLIRFRVDGVLREAGRVPRESYESILNRIKVQSRLRIDEHFAAQDGSMHFEQNGVKIDIRTSIIPTVDGEKVVLRMLSAYVEGFNLNSIGLNEEHRRLITEAAKKPFGMILVTGPTGSGKSTTLYTLLKLLNQTEVNITTIEDPVEYKVAGVNQIQVNSKTQLSFANGLRSIVRQDPDVILVGEIRDNETAEIGLNAALTGHLLLSTFHANNAATAIPRLLDMGLQPFLLASTLELLVAQRLVRKLCLNCRYSTSKAPSSLGLNKKITDKFFGKRKATVYEAKGCESCNHTGYTGRIAIFEMIAITPKMQDLILKSPSSQDIWKLAKKEGAVSLFEDGLEKVKNGVTTIEELKRVAEIPDFI